MEIIAHMRVDQSGKLYQQSLQTHLQHVASYMEQAAEPLGLKHVARLTGVLHDILKASQDFQQYLRWSVEHPHDHSMRGSVSHAAGGAQFLKKLYGQQEGTAQVIEYIGVALCSHHSGLLNLLSVEGKSDYLRRMLDEESLARVQEVEEYFFSTICSRKELDTLFAAASEEIHNLDRKIMRLADSLVVYGKASGLNDRQVQRYTFYWGMLERLLFSWLIDADWLDTAEYDSQQSWHTEWQEMALWQQCADKLEKQLASFSIPDTGKARTVALARRQISEQCLLAAGLQPGIYTLSVPTGSGKTYASMRYALAHGQKYHKRRIIVVIPYTSIIDQNAQDIRKLFQCDSAILEHHASVLLPEDAQAVDQAQKQILTERWDTPIIFTTQVQFLNTLFAGSSRTARRMQALTDSIIIFDEIQTLPVNCLYLFNEAVNFLKDMCGVTAVLCTATQPTLKAQSVAMESIGEMVNDLPHIFLALQRVHFHYEPQPISVDMVSAKLLQSALHDHSVLCIVNLTAEAHDIYAQVRKLAQEAGQKVDILHLSTKMCPAHRKAVISQMCDQLQVMRKQATAKPMICISTQLIEAGVDVSFATVYRAMAGFPSLAQAAGRCNRHGECDCGNVYIFDLQGENLTRLPDLEQGAYIARQMLHKLDCNDILQPEVMQQYFQYYYREQDERKKKFVIRESCNTIFDLLSENQAGIHACWEHGDESTLTQLCGAQAFRDAGQAFYVIAAGTQGVLVPYGKGVDYIEFFNKGAGFLPLMKKKLREAQQYMVNVFSYEMNRLREWGAISLTEQGIPALRKEYYDVNYGIKQEEQANDFIIL